MAGVIPQGTKFIAQSLLAEGPKVEEKPVEKKTDGKAPAVEKAKQEEAKPAEKVAYTTTVGLPAMSNLTRAYTTAQFDANPAAQKPANNFSTLLKGTPPLARKTALGFAAATDKDAGNYGKNTIKSDYLDDYNKYIRTTILDPKYDDSTEAGMNPHFYNAEMQTKVAQNPNATRALALTIASQAPLTDAHLFTANPDKPTEWDSEGSRTLFSKTLSDANTLYTDNPAKRQQFVTDFAAGLSKHTGKPYTQEQVQAAMAGSIPPEMYADFLRPPAGAVQPQATPPSAQPPAQQQTPPGGPPTPAPTQTPAPTPTPQQAPEIIKANKELFEAVGGDEKKGAEIEGILGNLSTGATLTPQQYATMSSTPQLLKSAKAAFLYAPASGPTAPGAPDPMANAAKAFKTPEGATPEVAAQYKAARKGVFTALLADERKNALSLQDQIAKEADPTKKLALQEQLTAIATPWTKAINTRTGLNLDDQHMLGLFTADEKQSAVIGTVASEMAGGASPWAAAWSAIKESPLEAFKTLTMNPFMRGIVIEEVRKQASENPFTAMAIAAVATIGVLAVASSAVNLLSGGDDDDE